MFEVDLEEREFNTKKAIKNSKKRFNYSKKILESVVISVITFIALTIFSIPFTNATLTPLKILLVCAELASSNILVSVIYNGIRKIITISKKEKANYHLNELKETLGKNGIKTNAKNLNDSIVLSETKKVTEDIAKDEYKSKKVDITEDSYYLFLDDKEQTQGFLESRNTSIVDKTKTEEYKFYILEQEDLEKFTPGVKQVKRLVRAPKQQ